MARKSKKGLDYFSHDVDMSTDNKIRMLQAKHGLVGYGVFIKILEELYREEGYFLKVDEDFLILLSSECKIEPSLIKDIINECLKRNLFDEYRFKSFSVLTSLRIQKNYLEGTERRKEISLFKEYLFDEILSELTTRKHKTNLMSTSFKHNVNILKENVTSCLHNDDINVTTCLHDDNILKENVTSCLHNDDILKINVDINSQKEKEKEKENKKENNNIYSSIYKNEIEMLLRTNEIEHNKFDIDKILELSEGDIELVKKQIKHFGDKGIGYLKAAIRDKYKEPKEIKPEPPKYKRARKV